MMVTAHDIDDDALTQYPLRLVVDGWGRIASAGRPGHFVGRPLLAWLVSDLSLSANDASEINESALLVANGQIHGFRTRVGGLLPGIDLCVSITSSSSGSVLDFTTEDSVPPAPPDHLPRPAATHTRSLTGATTADPSQLAPREQRAEQLRGELLETLGLADQMLAALDESSDLVAIADWRNLHWKYLNRAARACVGIGPDQTVDDLAFDAFLPELTAQRLLEEAEPVLARDGRWEAEVQFRHMNSDQIPVHVVVIARRDSSGLITQTTLIGRDLRESGHPDRRDDEPGTHDALTGLANHAAMFDMVERAVAEGGDGLALLFIDLDDFSSVNNEYGSDVGDELLIAVSRRVSHLLRSGDRVGRVGGDEFLVVCRCTDGESEARVIGDRLSAALARPFTLAGGATASGRASLGVALGRNGLTANELVGHSELAMHRAKDLGRGRVVFYGDEVIAAAIRAFSSRV